MPGPSSPRPRFVVRRPDEVCDRRPCIRIINNNATFWCNRLNLGQSSPRQFRWSTKGRGLVARECIVDTADGWGER